MRADPKQLAIYIGAIAVPVVLIGALLSQLAHSDKVPALPDVEQVQAASAIQPESTIASEAPAAPRVEVKAADAGTAQPVATPKSNAKEIAASKPDSKKAGGQVKAAHPKAKVAKLNNKGAGAGVSAEQFTEAYISIICKEGTQMFVDGSEKGKVATTGLTVTVSPGKHKIIVTSKSGGLYTQNIELEPGKTVRIKPNFCD